MVGCWFCLLRCTAGEVGAEAGIKDCLAIVSSVFVVVEVVVAGNGGRRREEEKGKETGTKQTVTCDGNVKGWS